MTQKRRARAGEFRASNYDVIVYAPENWLHRNRITVRDKDTRRVVEVKGYVVSNAIARAVKRLILENRRADFTTVTGSASLETDYVRASSISAVPFTLTDNSNG